MDKHLNGLSGKYRFHSLYKNTPAYIREGGKVPNLAGEKFYLVYYPDDVSEWYFHDDGESCFLKPERAIGGYMCLKTKGKDIFMLKALHGHLLCESYVINS